MGGSAGHTKFLASLQDLDMMCSIDILQKILNGLRSLVGGSAGHTKFLVSFQNFEVC